jgi:hypothetical protein
MTCQPALATSVNVTVSAVPVYFRASTFKILLGFPRSGFHFSLSDLKEDAVTFSTRAAVGLEIQ